MSREGKALIIDSLHESFSRSKVSILTDYRGLKTAELTVLRRRLQAANSEFKVVKNTLARLAAEKAGKGDLSTSLQGPVAIAFGYGNITDPVKVIADYIRETKTMGIKAGLLGDSLLTPEQVMRLATLPSREILLGMVLGQMKAPMSGLLGSLTAPMRGIVGVLQARIEQLEGEQNAGK
jgi:large subunit ribosomal protein L10